MEIILIVAIYTLVLIVLLGIVKFIGVFVGSHLVWTVRKIELLTFQERKFYYKLNRALKNKYLIFSKVRVGDIVSVTGINISQHYGLFAKLFFPLTMMHADFVLCRKPDSYPLLIIELDDSTHKTVSRTVKNDKIKNKAYKKAGIPILRLRIQQEYDEGQLILLVEEFINN